MEETEDNNLNIYIKELYEKYGSGIISETETCQILRYSKTHFHRLRKKDFNLIPFFKVGLRVTYLMDDVIAYLKKNRVK